MSVKQRPSKGGKPRRNGSANRYPKGWDRQRVEALAAYYDDQSDDDAIAEAETAYKDGATAMIQVPLELVPKVRKLLAKRAG